MGLVNRLSLYGLVCHLSVCVCVCVSVCVCVHVFAVYFSVVLHGQQYLICLHVNLGPPEVVLIILWPASDGLGEVDNGQSALSSGPVDFSPGVERIWKIKNTSPNDFRLNQFNGFPFAYCPGRV